MKDIKKLKGEILFLSFFLLVIVNNQVFAQYPRVGEKINDHVFTDVAAFSDHPVKLSDYRGKWLILDFWGSSCVVCIKAFPKMNDLYKDFKDKVDILMVGVYDNRRNTGGKTPETIIKARYAYHRKKHNLILPIAFDNNALEDFDIYAMPTLMVINPEGILVAKTHSIDSLQLANLIEGKSPDMQYAYSAHEIATSQTYNFKSPLLTTGSPSNGGIDSSFIFRSLITKYDRSKMPFFYIHGWDEVDEPSAPKGFAEAIGVNLTLLFRLGNFGRATWNYNDSLFNNKSLDLVLELKDDSLFKNHENDTKNWFSYSIRLPQKMANPTNFRLALLDDIKRYFGFESLVEVRKAPVYKLIVVNKKKAAGIKTHGGKSHILRWEDKVGFQVWNYPLSTLLTDFGFSVGLENRYAKENQNVPPMINATGIEFNVDLKFDGDVIDFENTRKNLQKSGLDLVLDTMDMERIVVRDVKP